MNFILLDFGASRIKSVLYDTETNEYSNIMSSEGASIAGKTEVPISFFSEVFKKHVKYHLSSKKNIDAINLCGEMHGFILPSDIDNLQDEKFISWRANNSKNLKHEFDYFFPNLDFKSITGMSEKAGLPVCNIRNHINFKKNSMLLNLFESLILIHGEWSGSISKSMAASSGLYDIHSDNWIDEISNIQNIMLPKVNKHIEKMYGYVNFNSQKIPVYGCIGDLQSSIASLDLSENEINVNLGTGSQVSHILNCIKGFEIRPLYDSLIFSSISHIPCGRVLNIFSKFFSEIEQTGSEKSIFWDIFFSKADIKNKYKIYLDLNMFQGSYKFNDGVSILKITEDNFDLKVFIDSIKFSLINQYSNIINDCNNQSNNKIKKIILTGALATKIADFKEIIENETGIEAQVAHTEIDTSLIGLAKISKLISKKIG